ncbi:mandelate racemase/muconate lactonizing enzyme family protein [Gulosibacter bifidus]|uniref:Dipeptide epimerase n=1 Tax=Gulosibacter bifidus TaxID=272239 RepID=A0ABW5RJU6_9MICO|nr:dipeptide epimerase [Gulosibacter bifidus]
MRVERADLYVTDLTLNRPFVVSYETYTTMPSIFIELHTDTGLTGWGEAVPDQHVTGETIGTVHTILRDELLPEIIGQNPLEIARIHQTMNRKVFANGAAKAAIDIACHDLLGKATGQPIYQLLGGKLHDVPPMAYVISIVPPDQAAREAKHALDETGYAYIKIKLGGPDLREDIARVAAVHQAVGPDIRICVDANQGWGNVTTAARAIRALEPYEPAWVEQPIPARQIHGFNALRNLTHLPLMADESLTDSNDLAQFIHDQSVELINIKLMKSGGIHPSRELATQAQLGGIRAQIGSMLESSVASAAGFHLAVAHPAIESTELSGPLWFTNDPGNLTYNLPRAELTDRPGLGIDIDESVLHSITQQHNEVTAP